MTAAHTMVNHERYKATRKVTLVGAVVNIFLALAQIVGGVLTHSQALIADGIHTLSDLASDVIVLIASREAHKKADDEHPYGHGRIETLATTALGVILVGAALLIASDTLGRLFGHSELLQPGPLALFFALLAVVSKESLYRYTIHVADNINSSLLRANAMHHRSDAISSLFVIAGVGLNLMGLPWFDAVAALIVAFMIGRMGWELVWQSGQELIDASLDEDVVAQIHEDILAIDGVVSLHQLRTRQSGSDAFADVHIQVPSHISVSEGHRIADAVKTRVIENFEQMTDVTVHTDPEDDDVAAPSRHLPLRKEMMAMLEQQWQGSALSEQIEHVKLHYLDGKIEIDVFLKAGKEPLLDAETAAFKEKLLDLAPVRSVEVYRPA